MTTSFTQLHLPKDFVLDIHLLPLGEQGID